jgi:hypothetical protein
MNTNKQKLETYNKFIARARKLYHEKYSDNQKEVKSFWIKCKEQAAKEIYNNN